VVLKEVPPAADAEEGVQEAQEDREAEAAEVQGAPGKLAARLPQSLVEAAAVALVVVL